MADLISIPGLGKSSLELLEAAGFQDAESLARAGVDELVEEIQRANGILRISKRTPPRSAIERWVEAARELCGVDHASKDEPVAMPVDYERTPQVISMLAAAPFAIPLPARVLVENGLGVPDIPAGILLNRYSGDLDVRVEARLPTNRNPKPAVSSNYVQVADSHAPGKVEIDRTRLRSTADLGDALPRVVAGVKPASGDDRVALIRAPRPTTNEGRHPKSRWYIRGVLHSHPVSIYVGALVTLCASLMVPVAVASALLLLGSQEVPKHFGWVPGWLLWFPTVLPLFGIGWLIWGLGGSCRICGQKLFVHRSHRKNARAHHVRGLGYVLPLCVQILLFRWFRCTHCGTPVRLKQ